MLALGAAAGAAISAPYPFVVPARAQSSPQSFRIGDAEITVVSDGAMSLPLAYVLPAEAPETVAKLLTPRGLGGDAYAAQVNITVIWLGSAVIVVDCGGGVDFVPTLGRFADRLELAGVKPDAVTHVIFTHAHPDHFWGLFDPLDDDTRFSKARHIMSSAERDHWLKPGVENTMPEAMKGITLGTARRLRSIAARVETVNAGTEVLPGITLVDTAGHTPGHVSVRLQSAGQSLLIGGDALSHPVVSFEKPEWVWGPDLEPQKAIATRRRLLDQLATDRTPLLGYHLPWPGLGRVERKDNAYRFVVG